MTFFFLQRLLNKICFFSQPRAELPPEQYHTLKDQLIEKIAQFAKGPKIVLTRLCIGVSNVYAKLCCLLGFLFFPTSYVIYNYMDSLNFGTC